MPRPAVERLQYPVALVRKHEGLAGHAVAPKNGEHLKALIDGHAKIAFVRDDQGRRLDVVRVEVRGESGELGAGHGGPWRTAEFPVRKPELFGRETHRLEVEHSVVGHRGLETIGVTEDPVHRVAAIAGARYSEPLRIGKRQLRDSIDDGVDVGHHLAGPISTDVVDEGLTEPERPAGIRRGDHPALRRPQRRIPSC